MLFCFHWEHHYQKVEIWTLTSFIPVNRTRHRLKMSLTAIAAALILILSACSTSSTPNTVTTSTTTTTNGSQPSAFGLAALPGYTISLFASQTGAYIGPDSLVVDNGFVYIDYQNTTAKDCTDTFTST